MVLVSLGLKNENFNFEFERIESLLFVTEPVSNAVKVELGSWGMLSWLYHEKRIRKNNHNK